MTEEQAWIDLLKMLSCIGALPLAWFYGKRFGAWLVNSFFNWVANHGKN